MQRTQPETDQHKIRATSSPPARPRRLSTARVSGSTMPSRSSEALRPWSTVLSRCRCAGSVRIWAPTACSADGRGRRQGAHQVPDRQPRRRAAPARTTFVRRETWFLGWSAEIDGRPTAIQSANGLFHAVTVPAGSHHITFSFVPPGMNRALLGWLAGGALMLVPTARSASSFRVRR